MGKVGTNVAVAAGFVGTKVGVITGRSAGGPNIKGIYLISFLGSDVGVKPVAASKVGGSVVGVKPVATSTEGVPGSTVG